MTIFLAFISVLLHLAHFHVAIARTAKVLSSDGPIIYGTEMKGEDRARAWQRFYVQMTEASAHQQGSDALKAKLVRRCLPDEDHCTIAIDANLVGIGGQQDPRKVVLIIATDVADESKQLSRTVCTWPTKDTVACRDWDTGNLIMNSSALDE